jgi:hypothetical protein
LPYKSVFYWCEFIVEFTTNGDHRGARGSVVIKYHGFEGDIEKFTESNNYGLWKVKMRAVLIQNKCVEALKGESRFE